MPLHTVRLLQAAVAMYWLGLAGSMVITNSGLDGGSVIHRMQMHVDTDESFDRTVLRRREEEHAMRQSRREKEERIQQLEKDRYGCFCFMCLCVEQIE